MKLALNGATTMHADLQTDIKAAKAAGFELIEIWAAKLRTFLETNTVADLKTLLDDAGLQPWSINSIEHITFRTADDYENIIKAQCEELCSIAGQIGCKYVVVVPGKLPEGLTEEQITDESIVVLNELADIAEKHNVGLAFEFLGQTDCSVQTLDHCNKIVEKINRANVGNVIDTFHFYAGNSTMEAIDTMKPENLFIFHVNDSEDLPKEQLNDSHRLYPGLGILPLTEMKKRLDNIGYTEMASIEIFRPEYWNHDPYEVAKLSRENTIKAFGLEKAATA